MSGRDWWSLPGPSEFLQRILEQIREGYHAVILMPEFGPSDVRDELFSDVTLGLETLQVDERSPFDALMDRAGRSTEKLVSTPASAVADVPELNGRVFWLESMSAYRWPEWRRFIEDLQQTTRNQPRLERTLLVVELRGELVTHVPRDEGGIAVVRYDNAFNHIDMLAFVDRLVRARGLSRVHRIITVEVVAALAAFDPDLARALSYLELRELLHDCGVFTEVAGRRGWTSETAASWELGSSMFVGGSDVTHSALPSASEEIQSRRWSALVSTVFVHIERRRREYTKRYSRELDIAPGNGMPEIAQIFDLLQKGVSESKFTMPHGTLNRLGQLRSLRNQLAHYLVPDAVLLDEDVLLGH